MEVQSFRRFENRLKNLQAIKLYGHVARVNGLVIESVGPPASIGDLCFIYSESGNYLQAEVVGFNQNRFYLMPYGNMEGISPGSQIVSLGRPLSVAVGEEMKGRILNGLGEFIDEGPEMKIRDFYSLQRNAPEALKRQRIQKPLYVGVRAIDGCLPIGLGQRIGIFSGSGVGKSTLLGMMARGSEADINVIALIGERGREVREFIEKDLGEEGLKKSVVVVVTSDEPAILRLKGAYVATAIAEYFRDQGLSVLLMMDSLTRFAMGQREIGLALGEPPTSKGYTPSVFALLPKLLERSGMGEKGSISAFYTVLVDADDFNEPISDNCRAILDGHIVLSRKLASRNHYPSIDILESVSRLSVDIASKRQLELLQKLKELLAVYEEARDLINIGAYVKGSNAKIDESVSKIDRINKLLKQNLDEVVSFEETMKDLEKIFA